MKKDRQNESMLIGNSELEVNEETSRLKKVLMWGAPGSEAVLAQLLPKKISCFESEFNVPDAGIEFVKAKSMLEKHGVDVISVKDLFAKMIDTRGTKPRVDLDTLKVELKKKGEEYYEKYKDEEGKEGGISGIYVLDWIDQMIDRDVATYGESTAIVMNDILSLQSKSGLPLANVLYARDQSNLLGKTWVWSSMEHNIRKEEVGLYKEVLHWAGVVKPSEVTEIQVINGKFEGGDGIVHNGICYIGVGGRTNLCGVTEVARAILTNGLRVVAVYDGKRTRKEEKEMDAMHFDTFCMPCGKNKMVVCKDEAKRRKFIELTIEDGELKISRKGKFMDHLSESRMELVPLTKYEQLHYAPNFVNIDDNSVILSLADENGLTEELGTAGMSVECANLKQITKGFGGLHCMTAAIKRE